MVKMKNLKNNLQTRSYKTIAWCNNFQTITPDLMDRVQF